VPHPATDFRRIPLALIFVLLFAVVLLLHLPLLRLPYFWDEAGYYVPAARDLLYSGSLIPRSTPSNAHPPLVMAWLALWWKIAGFSPFVTRTAMLAISAFSLTGIFRLAKRVANLEVAIASTVCTMLYPVFFAQSSLAHVDLAAAGLTFWGLSEYVERRFGRAAIWLSLAVLAKETAILAPVALAGWELVCPFFRKQAPEDLLQTRSWRSLLLLVPCVPLGLWYGYHYSRTGFVFGNPEFFRYNVQATVQPQRVFLDLLMRLWQVLGYFGLYLLTLATLLAMWLPPRHDADGPRRRISLHTQFSFLALIGIYVVAMAVVGGAVLARYMLPAVPLVVILGVSTLRRRARLWREVLAIIVMAFVAGLFVNPPYGFSVEDNLGYRDFIVLHQHAEEFLQTRYPRARVLTAWPASEELTQPFLGYVARPMRVLRIEDFTAGQLLPAAALGPDFDVALVFSLKYEPPHPIFERWHTWVEWKTRFFGYHRDLPPAAAAQVLGGHLVYMDQRNGQWIGVIEMDRIEEAQIPPR
jgi:4-amino-4-deoxy-L-arabinose transferase-like glycosyltransferase